MKNKKTNLQWGSSLKYLEWENKGDQDKVESLISDTVHEWYDAKHRSVPPAEIDLINSIEIKRCPLCGDEHIVKNGFSKTGIRSFKCRNCNHKFSPLTNTIFENGKIPISEWIEYLIHLFEFHSLRTSARDNRNAQSTGKYWLIKVFSVLEHVQDNVVLEGKVYIDETYFPVIKHKVQLKDGKKLRGISRNKIAVATGRDEYGHKLLIVENTSKPSNKSTWVAFGNHIKPGSHLIHDGEHSHNILVQKLNLTEEVYETSQTKNVEDKDNPLDPINDIHALAKRYMNAHGGYNRDNLQDWMNLIWFILSGPINRYEKVKKFIEMAINSPRKVKYRDVMSKKVTD